MPSELPNRANIFALKLLGVEHIISVSACGSMREQFAPQIAGKEKTIIPGDDIDIDFTSGTIAWRGDEFAFSPLGSVPQSLVIADGVENLVAKRLGLA